MVVFFLDDEDLTHLFFIYRFVDGVYTDVICNPFCFCVWKFLGAGLLAIEIGVCISSLQKNTLNLNFDSTDINLILVTIYYIIIPFWVCFPTSSHMNISPYLTITALFFGLGCFITHPSPKPRKMSPVKNN